MGAAAVGAAELCKVGEPSGVSRRLAMSDRILIVGASGRAAAGSALRAGFEPFVIDLFADADTVRLCPTLKCDPAGYPHGFVELAKQAPPGPWMYTGGLENHPEVIAAISQKRELWGNGPEHFPNVRDPFRLFATYTAYGLDCPLVCPIAGPSPRGLLWLSKQFASGGGRGVKEYKYSPIGPRTGDYLQEFIVGDPVSALFLSMPWRVYFLGMASQLVGTPWLHARPFEYAGNIGPLTPTDTERATAERLGFAVTQSALKFGYFGIDLVRAESGLMAIEVNPRYTASIEVYEMASRTASLRWHVDCATCVEANPDEPWSEPTEFAAPHVVGKAIYYAAKSITFPASGPWDDSLARCRDVWHPHDFADIPHPGTRIEPGQPVFTLFAAAPTEAECIHQLKAKAAECDRLFGVPTPEDDP